MAKLLQNNKVDFLGKQYIIHRANELLRYGWIKMLLG